MIKCGIASKRVVMAAASAVVFAIVSGASAGDGALDTPSRDIGWSGFYLGVHAGYGWGDISIADGGTAIGNNAPPYGAFACGPAKTGNYCNNPLDLDANGFMGGGAHVGFNWQSGNFVLGFEGELGRADVTGDKTLVRPFDDQDFASVTFDWYATVTGRVGYSWDRALVYLKGGAAFARAEIHAGDMDSGVIYPGSEVRSNELLQGWALGAGWEYALTRQLSLKAEYLYMDFGSGSARSSDGDIYDYDAKLHTAKVGLSLRLQP